MELNTKCVFVANTCKMLTSLLTSVKGAIENDCNKSASSRSIKWGGTGGSEPPASRTLLSRFPYLYLPPPARFRAAPVPCKLAESKHILVL